MKLVGMLLIAVCGAVTGQAVAAVYVRAVELIRKTAELFLQLEFIMEHEAPDVAQMLGILRKTTDKLPVFLDSLTDGEGASSVLCNLEENRDGYSEQDLERLRIYFSQVGSADRLSELKRLKAVRAYFESRLSAVRPDAEKHAALSRRLGMLIGILFAVMLI